MMQREIYVYIEGGGAGGSGVNQLRKSERETFGDAAMLAIICCPPVCGGAASWPCCQHGHDDGPSYGGIWLVRNNPPP